METPKDEEYLDLSKPQEDIFNVVGLPTARDFDEALGSWNEDFDIGL